MKTGWRGRRGHRKRGESHRKIEDEDGARQGEIVSLSNWKSENEGNFPAQKNKEFTPLANNCPIIPVYSICVCVCLCIYVCCECFVGRGTDR